MSVGEREKWWERIETSSNPYHKDRLLNGNLHDEWDSMGRTGSHWIRITVKKGFIVRKLYLHVDSKDVSKMPQQVIVSAGPHSHDLTDLSTVKYTFVEAWLAFHLFVCYVVGLHPGHIQRRL